jgi:hypothetical protein
MASWGWFETDTFPLEWGDTEMTYGTIAQRAVVLGSGMAGLFTARVLSD